MNGQPQNEFDGFFDLMNDVEHLHDFFEKNKEICWQAFLES
jgi:hypothetical protein